MLRCCQITLFVIGKYILCASFFGWVTGCVGLVDVVGCNGLVAEVVCGWRGLVVVDVAGLLALLANIPPPVVVVAGSINK